MSGGACRMPLVDGRRQGQWRQHSWFSPSKPTDLMRGGGPGRCLSEFYLVAGDGIVVPFQAVTGDTWQVQLARADLKWVS